MKSVNKIIILLMAICGIFSQSCTDNIALNSSIDDKPFDGVNDSYAYIRTVNSNSKPIELYNDNPSKIVEIEFSITNPINKIVEANVVYDADLLTSYNESHNTSFEIFPVEGIEFENNGIYQMAPGDAETYTLNLKITKPDGMDEGTFVIPLRIDKVTDGINFSDNESKLFLLVKNNGSRPSTDKPGRYITICYVEVNSHNPLNAGEWTLATSGKPIIDIVNIFAANINYDEDNKTPYVYLNKNVQYILEHRDKFIKPLQDKGIKVCLTILGNGQGVGPANLSDADACKFAKELKAIVDAYGLDGVDFDDEWSKYEDFDRPGFPDRGPYPYSRLCYEVKRLMPDKLCTVYYIGSVVPFPEQGFNGFDFKIDGMCPGDFIDYSYSADYGALKPDSYKTILGMKSEQWGGYSIDLLDDIDAQDGNIDYAKNSGNGVQVIYDLRATDIDAITKKRYMNTFSTLARKLYEDEAGARHSGINYYKEW